MCMNLTSPCARDFQLGSRASLPGIVLVDFIAFTHCCCSGVIVAEPSDSCLMRVKLSTMAPTKRLSETNAPKAGNTMRCGVWEKVPT